MNPVNVSELIERQKLGGFALLLIVWCFAIVLIDGYDQVAAAFAAPALIHAWHTDAAGFGRVFGVGLFGVLVGSLLLGFSGDRFGRRLTIIYGSIWFGMLTFLCSYASSVEQLTLLRFFAGVGMGGVVPNTVTLVSEYAPKARRATWVTLMFSGFSIGAGGGGAVASWLLPRYGWPVLFTVGGTAAVVVAFRGGIRERCVCDWKSVRALCRVGHGLSDSVALNRRWLGDWYRQARVRGRLDIGRGIARDAPPAVDAVY